MGNWHWQLRDALTLSDLNTCHKIFQTIFKEKGFLARSDIIWYYLKYKYFFVHPNVNCIKFMSNFFP